ncbi:hypothetical protein L6452_30111 [Arctium lappa]|uniref:Uncharacterized protein n=1 Tax=Arctium lappa TaxID=4217 RepID=A0ACB8ZM66_ARCLA|nr:hypothetical protein L6452_30111 [Arctium lappa]
MFDEFNEEDLKETFLCLKSSFTYAAKLLNLVLTSSSEASPPSIENVWNPAVAVMPLRSCLSEKYTELLPSYKWVNDDESWVSVYEPPV